MLAPRLRPTEGQVWPSGPEADAESAIDGDDFEWPSAEFFNDAGISDPLGDWAHDSPQPIAVRDLLHDLHIVITGHVVATGLVISPAPMPHSHRRLAQRSNLRPPIPC